jgi:predicted TIM-barrel fold metal-dependent hydrolase
MRAIRDLFGAQHMYCGSHYPVVRMFMTYRQALEVFKTHCEFVSEDDKTSILGKGFFDLLEING